MAYEQCCYCHGTGKKHAVDVMALEKFAGMFNSIVNSHVVSATARERLVALCVMA